MFSPITLVALSLFYVAVLFVIASWGDGQHRRALSPRWRAVVYSLSLAVYCSSWTFYGAVGSAVSSGWLFVAIYLGPALLMLLGYDLMQRILSLTKAQRITSIADFIAYRYGKGRGVAALVAVAAVLGSLPYIALQLKGVTMALVISSQNSDQMAGLRHETALVLALALALFAILFGARRLDASEHHRGMVIAVAFESVVKLMAFAAVGLWALYGLLDGPAALVETIRDNDQYRELFMPDTVPEGFWVQTILAAAAIFCLPRQFHVAFVENEDKFDLRIARWLFPFYLFIFSLLVVPIAVAGMERFSEQAINADTYVLTLPMAANQPLMTLLTFLGGFSAATGMVIMATVALSTMVSNDLILPLLLLRNKRPSDFTSDFSRILLNSRRYTIVALSLVAWLYYLLIEESAALAALGLISFAAAVQFAPALVAGVYWRQASREGALAGLIGGFSAWLLFIVLPPFTPLSWHLSDLGFSQAVWLSLGINLSGIIIGSLWSRHRHVSLPTILAANGEGRISVNELRRLAAHFIGQQRVEEAFRNVLDEDQGQSSLDAPAEGSLIRFTERLLAGCVGAASARAVMTTGLRGSGVSRGETMMLLEQTSSAIQFNRDLLEATLDNISQGVSVVDVDLRLVSWNRAYLELLEYPPGFVYVGRPVEELIRYNVERGLCGPGEREEQVNRRMYHMRRGAPYIYERQQAGGQVIEIRGSPMPQGGYVTTYIDVTHYKRSEEALRASEKRIRLYTDNAPALLAYVDRNLNYRFANRAYRRLVGGEDLEVEGRYVEEVLSPAEFTKRSPYIDGVLAGERQQFELSLTDAAGPGRERYAIGTYIPDFDETNQVRGFFAVLQDISTRRRAELALHEAYATMEQKVEQRTQELRETMEALNRAKQEAERANQSKTSFLAAASHDLLQPLNAARLFSSVLAQSAHTLPEEPAALIGRVDHSLAAAEELLSALLDITRLDQGALKPSLVIMPVSRLLEKIRGQFSDLAVRRGLRLRVRECDAVIESDPQLLQRVLLNLVSNALRYTRQGGVLVACRRRGERLRITVWDTGPGIPQHEQSRIFMEFQRLDEPYVEKGLGLGLAICERIARMLDAPLGLRSRVGRGSCFHISVPLKRDLKIADVPVVAADATEAQPPLGDFAGKHILCLDDDPEILEGMQSLLSRWGCSVMVAQTQEEAMARARHQAPDLLLVDFQLGGGLDGLDAAQAINGVLDKPRPVLVITADHSEHLADRVRQCGYQRLFKPVKLAALRALMRNLLRQQAQVFNSGRATDN